MDRRRFPLATAAPAVLRPDGDSAAPIFQLQRGAPRLAGR